MVKIVQKNEPVLRGNASKVPMTEICSEKIRNIIENMKKALDSQEDGVAIAAPQIGEPLQIFVVSGKAFDIASGQDSDKKIHKDMVFINPEIIKISKETQDMEEGCLSVRWIYGKVKRATRAKIRAYDENGKIFEKGAKGLIAQIFQHETDHLNGVLFTDKATDMRDIPPEENKI